MGISFGLGRGVIHERFRMSKRIRCFCRGQISCRHQVHTIRLPNKNTSSTLSGPSLRTRVTNGSKKFLGLEPTKMSNQSTKIVRISCRNMRVQKQPNSRFSHGWSRIECRSVQAQHSVIQFLRQTIISRRLKPSFMHQSGINLCIPKGRA